jgi:molybdopterin-binding protein
MKISARNCLKGKVKSITHGPVSAEVVIKLASGIDVTSVITDTAAKELGLKTGSAAYRSSKPVT